MDMNGGGSNPGPNGIPGSMYVRAVDASSFQEHFWPQPIMEASMVGAGQMQQAGGQMADGSGAVNNMYQGVVNGGNKPYVHHYAAPPLPLSDPASPRIAGVEGGQFKKRVAKACDHCRKRKIKCGALNPATQKCANCTKYCVSCTFSKPKDEPERRTRNGDYMEVLQGQTGEGLGSMRFAVPLEYNLDIANELAASGNGSSEARASIDGRVEKLDRKVSVIIDKFSKMERLIQKLLDNKNLGAEGSSFEKPKQKRYSATLLTLQKLIWFKQQLNPEDSYESFFKPLTYLMTTTLKLYIIQMRALMDLSPMTPSGRYTLKPIPPRAQSKRLMENFQETMRITSAPGVFGLDYYSELIDKFHDEGVHSLSCAELMLLNTSICFGASRMRQLDANDTYHLRKDKFNPSRKELKNIENETLLNALFFYNKVVVSGGGTIEVQGLILLSSYLQENVDTELALAVLATAIRFASDNEYHRVVAMPSPVVSLQDDILRRSLWWHCYNKDRKFALILSRQPIIKDDDTNVFTDEAYCDIAKRMLLHKFPQRVEEIGALDTVEMALNYAVKYSEFLPFFISYYIQKLGRIESEIVDTCFCFKSISTNTFDQLAEKLMNLRKELIDWEASLHPSMRLDTFKKYISLLFLPNDVENPGLSYEIMSSRVIVCHIRSLQLKNLLCLFASSFLLDNSDEFKFTRYKTLSYYETFKEEGLESCMQILRIFQVANNDLRMYNDSFYSLLTAAFSLILHVAKNINSSDNKRIPSIIELLIKNHELLLGSNNLNFVTDNVKWSTSLFFYTFLLSKVVCSFNDRSPFAKDYKFESDSYCSILKKMLCGMEILKNEALDRLQSSMEKSPATEERATGRDTMTPIQISPLSRCNFANLDEETLNYFRSTKFFKISPSNKSIVTPLPFGEDNSLFRTTNTNSATIYDAFAPTDVGGLNEKRERTHSELECFPNSAKKDSEDIMEVLQNFFCQNELFFDRDLKFAAAFRDKILEAL